MHVLEGVIVLDFTQGMPGSVAAMVLSDFGAEVIKVEPPGGERFRAWPASLQWNRGKKSVVLDLKTSEGCEKVQRLVQEADVVIESFRPGVTKRLGIDYETLSAGRPDLVYCSLTGFGPKGPYNRYKGYEGVVAAKSGRMMAFAGQNVREGPNYVVVQNASHAAAMAIVRGVIAALYVRDKTGQGQKVETSLLQTITPFDNEDWILWQMMMKDPEGFPEGSWLRGYPHVGYSAARTKDGRWIQLGNIIERSFRTTIHALGLDFIYEDPRFKTAPVLTDEDREILREMMLKQIRGKTLDEWMDIFVNQTSDVAAEPLMTTEEGMKHPQILHNGHVQEVDDPRVGKMLQLGPLALLRETPGSLSGPSPDIGQHTREVLGRLNGVSTKVFPGVRRPLPSYPLEGITLLDLSTFVVGPLACALVAELGARIIRIESLEGDYLRGFGLMPHRTMAGTEGLSLNLKTPEGREIIHKLAAKADILVHNMRPGAPERVGIGYQQLRQINPRLVYIYAAGYGSTGPHTHRPSMAPIAGAVCGGALAQMGRGALPPPQQPLTIEEIKELSRKLGHANAIYADHNASMVISAAILLGLYARERTGKAQYIESTMLAANAYANADDFFWYEGKLPRPLPDPDGYGLNALYRLYRAQRGWVFLACLFEEEWQALCHAIGRSDLLKDPRFATPQSRQNHDAALAEELERVFATMEPLEWEKLLTAADVACVQAEDWGPYHFFAEDPHVKENGFITDVESPRLGKFWRYSPLLVFSHTLGKAGPGILKGQHTRAILGELGYGGEEIREFKEQGVVDWEEP